MFPQYLFALEYRCVCGIRVYSVGPIGTSSSGICLAVNCERAQGVGGRVCVQSHWTGRLRWWSRSCVLVHRGTGRRWTCLWKQGQMEGTGHFYGFCRSSQSGTCTHSTLLVCGSLTHVHLHKHEHHLYTQRTHGKSSKHVRCRAIVNIPQGSWLGPRGLICQWSCYA